MKTTLTPEVNVVFIFEPGRRSSREGKRGQFCGEFVDCGGIADCGIAGHNAGEMQVAVQVRPGRRCMEQQGEGEGGTIAAELKRRTSQEIWRKKIENQRKK